MQAIKRRDFLLAALAAAPLASCASAPRASLAQRRHAGTLVRAGHDRTGQPRNVFGGLRIDAKVAPGDTADDLYTTAGSGASRRWSRPAVCGCRLHLLR